MPLKTVLMADDEPSLRTLVRATIESEDYRLLEAEDGAQAWTLLQQHRPDLALLDVQMPGQTGLELTRAIRADPALAHMSIILLTSRGNADDVQAGLDAGANQYLTKPFSPLALLAAIERALGLV